MKEREKIGRKIVVKTQRKSHGGKGKERGGKTGKIATVSMVFPSGEETEPEVYKAPTFRALQRMLRRLGLIPTHVSLKSKGTTIF